jgi:hypothetical protein
VCKLTNGTCVAPPSNREPSAVCGGPSVGRCLALRSGVPGNDCDCADGYQGADCSACAPGFESLPAPASWGWGPTGSICSRLPPPSFRDSPIRTVSSSSLLGVSASQGGLGGGAIAGLVLAGTTVLVLLSATAIVVVHRRRDYARHAHEVSAHSPGMLCNSPMYLADALSGDNATLLRPMAHFGEQAQRPGDA